MSLSNTITRPAARFQSVGVIGGGAWGTALASLCANNGVTTVLWARNAEVAQSINATGENKRYLPGLSLPTSLEATNDLSDLREHELLILATPAQFSRAVLRDLRAVATAEVTIVSCAKGIEQKTGLTMSEMIAEIWPDAKIAVLSGPGFARDVAGGKPTAVTLACADQSIGEQCAHIIAARHFRPYLSADIIGTELGGAVKNVLAIAAGIVTGREFGESARAALIARGFREFQRLSAARGAALQTMSGLSGMGDLILTATSRQSRNMSLGVELGKGRALPEIISERHTVSEGIATARAVAAMAANANVEMPICQAIADLVDGRKSIDEIIDELLSRPLTFEH